MQFALRKFEIDQVIPSGIKITFEIYIFLSLLSITHDYLSCKKKNKKNRYILKMRPAPRDHF